MKYYISSVKIPFYDYNYQAKKDEFLDKYGQVLKKYNLQFLPVDPLDEYPNEKHRATIDINSLEELNELSEIAFQGIIVTGNEITIYDGYNE